MQHIIAISYLPFILRKMARKGSVFLKYYSLLCYKNLLLIRMFLSLDKLEDMDMEWELLEFPTVFVAHRLDTPKSQIEAPHIFGY